MGTRNLTAVVLDGQYRVAQYGQFDGYPSGVGQEILEFLLSCDLDKLKSKVDLCSSITPEEIERIRIETGDDDSWIDKYPNLYRNTAGKILEFIYNSDPEDGCSVKLSLRFAADSLFCEWGYVIDFDKRTFEVFRGFNRKPLEEGDRFFFLQDIEKIKAEALKYGENGYYPIRLYHTFPLDNLPDTEKFISTLGPERED